MARIAEAKKQHTAVSCPLVHLTPPHTHLVFVYVRANSIFQTAWPQEQWLENPTQQRSRHFSIALALFTLISSVAWQNKTNENTILRTFLWAAPYNTKNIHTQFT